MTAGANLLTASATSHQSGGPPTPVFQIRAFIEAFERLGYDVGGLLDFIGLSRDDLDDPDGLLPCGVTGSLFGRAQQMRPLKNLWTRLAAETPVGAFRLFDYLVLTSDSVGDGLKQLARYYRLVGAPYVIDIRDNEDPIRVIYLHHEAVLPCSVEYGVTLTVRNLRAETGNHATFAYVSFTHEPDDVSEIERLLGCVVRSRASWAGFAVPREIWPVPLRRRDPVLRGLLESQAGAITPCPTAQDGLALDVRHLLASRLARGETQIGSIARELGTSARTLQRRLSVAGVSYEQLLDDVRRDAAETRLADRSLSIGEVAYLIGYSEPAAFHRAFKRWYGMTPERFRSERRASGRTSSLADTKSTLHK